MRVEGFIVSAFTLGISFIWNKANDPDFEDFAIMIFCFVVTLKFKKR